MTAPTSLSQFRPDADAACGFQGIRMLEIDLCQPLPVISSDGQHQQAWVLARFHSEPLGSCVVDLADGQLSPEELGVLVWREFGLTLVDRFVAAGLPPPRGLPGSGLDVEPALWPYLQARSHVLEAPPRISVVVCTRERPAQLRVCLSLLAGQHYPNFEVIVVDNAPETTAVRALVASLGESEFRYVVEPRLGLSRARNTGASIASGDVIAFLDDDEEPDAFWLAALARGFARDDDVGCVTGLILPARLDTEAELLFEQLGGHSMGRAFRPATFAKAGPQSPLYPLPPFGAGGNMAFRRDALSRIGNFDVALGAGTPARGGEDTLALTLVLLAGYRIAYEPAAFVRHHHYRDFAGLARQLNGYGVGLTAFYTALLCRRPWALVPLMKLLPAALRYLKNSASPAVTWCDQLPRLAQQRRRGMVMGPAAYLRRMHTKVL